MSTPACSRLNRILTSALLLVAFLFSGCASDDGPRPPGGKDAVRPAPLPNLAGQETFFDGQILAEMKVGAMTGFNPQGMPGGGGPEGKLHGRGNGGLSVGGVGMGLRQGFAHRQLFSMQDGTFARVFCGQRSAASNQPSIAYSRRISVEGGG